jgi:hypothetical protein
MKILSRTRLTVVAAAGLACIAAILVFAQKPTPTPIPPKDQPVQLDMQGVPYPCDHLSDALNKTKWSDTQSLAKHQDYFKLSYGSQDIGGGTWKPDVGGGTYKPRDVGAYNNVTQHVALENWAE